MKKEHSRAWLGYSLGAAMAILTPSLALAAAEPGFFYIRFEVGPDVMGASLKFNLKNNATVSRGSPTDSSFYQLYNPSNDFPADKKKDFYMGGGIGVHLAGDTRTDITIHMGNTQRSVDFYTPVGSGSSKVKLTQVIRVRNMAVLANGYYDFSFKHSPRFIPYLGAGLGMVGRSFTYDPGAMGVLQINQNGNATSLPDITQSSITTVKSVGGYSMAFSAMVGFAVEIITGGVFFDASYRISNAGNSAGQDIRLYTNTETARNVRQTLQSSLGSTLYQTIMCGMRFAF